METTRSLPFLPSFGRSAAREVLKLPYRVSRQVLRRVMREYLSRQCFAEAKVDLHGIEHFTADRFPDSGPLPWLDRPGAEAEVDRREASGELSAAEARLCRQWMRDGYVILERAFASAFLDRVWAAYEEALASGRISAPDEGGIPGDPYPGRPLNAHLALPELNEMLRGKPILDALRLLIGREPIPYQTLISHKSTEQLEHSDSIHMTSYPLGYMSASWTAFEDIHPDSGPLVYYPGSHRLPYYFASAVGLSPDEFRKQKYVAVAEKYEPFIQKCIREQGLKPLHFHPRKGDVLIWHANLLHGGSRRKNIALSRKNLVNHYFFKGAIAYHDLAGTLANVFRDSVQPLDGYVRKALGVGLAELFDEL